MRSRARVLGLGSVVAAATLIATFALAQPRRGGAKPAARPKPAASPAPETTPDDKSGAAPASSGNGAPSAPGANDTTTIPAPPSDTTADGGRLSPLNPAANEFSDAGPSAPSVDYDRLLGDIGALRARVAAVSDTLFHSRIAITLETSSDHGKIASLAVSLDDGAVWTAPATFHPEDATTVYDHAVAPGHHAVTVDVERRDDRNDAFRASQRSRFIVDVPADERLVVDLKLWDDSSMGGDFPSDKSGQYELRVRARAKAQPLPR